MMIAEVDYLMWDGRQLQKVIIEISFYSRWQKRIGTKLEKQEIDKGIQRERIELGKKEKERKRLKQTF